MSALRNDSPSLESIVLTHVGITGVFRGLDNLQLKVLLPSSSLVEIVVLMPNSHCKATTMDVKGLLRSQQEEE